MSLTNNDFSHVFPSAIRANAAEPLSYSGVPFLYSRKMTEWNETNLIRCLADNNNGSFVISTSVSNPFEFCVHGYYFRYDGTLSGNNYADIELTSLNDSSSQYSELKSATISATVPSTPVENHFYLLLTKADGSNTIIPDSSKIKFSASSINFDVSTLIDTIDGNKND